MKHNSLHGPFLPYYFQHQQYTSAIFTTKETSFAVYVDEDLLPDNGTQHGLWTQKFHQLMLQKGLVPSITMCYTPVISKPVSCFTLNSHSSGCKQGMHEIDN